MITKKKKVFFSKKDRRYVETELSIIWTNILGTFLHRKSPKKVYKHLPLSFNRKMVGLRKHCRRKFEIIYISRQNLAKRSDKKIIQLIIFL
jgi:hypothetical protein